MADLSAGRIISPSSEQIEFIPDPYLLRFDFLKGWNAPVDPSFVEKKQGFSYLSWIFAQYLLQEYYAGVQVDFEVSPEGTIVWYEQGKFLVNYGKTTVEGRMAYLRPYLTNGVQRTPALYFPVMDARKNAAINPDVRLINDNIQRAISKTISTFTGLGAKLYAGEDLEHLDANEKQAAAPATKAEPKAEAPQDPLLGSSESLRKWFHAELTSKGLTDHGRETLKKVMDIKSTNDLTESRAKTILTRLTPSNVEAFNAGKNPRTGDVVLEPPTPKEAKGKKTSAKAAAESLAATTGGAVVEDVPPF